MTATVHLWKLPRTRHRGVNFALFLPLLRVVAVDEVGFLWYPIKCQSRRSEVTTGLI